MGNAIALSFWFIQKERSPTIPQLSTMPPVDAQKVAMAVR